MELKRALPFLLLALTGCQRDQWDDCVTSAGAVREEERIVEVYDRIEISDRIDLVVEDRAPGTVAVQGGGNLLGQIETEVKDGELRIRNRMKCNWVRNLKQRVTVRASAQGICRITLRGTGDMRCIDTLRCDYFLLEQWGAEGDAELLVRTTRCDIALHTGAGAAAVRGSTVRAELFSGIMAPLDASGLRAEDCAVRNGGVADIRCWATGRLDAAIEDVGDVYYRGAPPELNSAITGSGRLIPE